MTQADPDRRSAIQGTVRGRVQAVGFRFFVERTARELGITGWVRNLDDGESVELYAEGDAQALERLRRALAEGPPQSRVESVDLRPAERQGSRGFEVRF
jgi:acylphosphatase